jgi:mannosidase alpha-like ER degradation enhancer 2
VYNNCLLKFATDMGTRLLPAFDTSTGIPYGTINLHSGVPKGETELASTAGAGSLVLEFEVLSCLTGKGVLSLWRLLLAELVTVLS